MKNSAYSIFLILVGAWFHPGLSAQSPHDLYDLRPGVERFFDRCPSSPFAFCMIGEKSFVHEVVIGTTSIGSDTYAVLVRRGYEYGGFPSNITDTLHMAVRDGKLLQYSNGSIHEVMDFDAPFLSTADEGALVLADTSAIFPDGFSYRVALATLHHHGSPVTNGYLADRMLTAALADLSGYGAITGWLLPLGAEAPNLTIGSGYWYYISRFGLVFSRSDAHPGALIIFRSHDGIWYGAPKEHYPVLPTSIDPADPPFEISLLPNYPNPFNPSTQIRWTLDAGRQTRLSVYDLLGREVVVLADGQFGAGTHTAIFDGSGLASGIYLVRLEAGGIVRMMRITLLK